EIKIRQLMSHLEFEVELETALGCAILPCDPPSLRGDSDGTADPDLGALVGALAVDSACNADDAQGEARQSDALRAICCSRGSMAMLDLRSRIERAAAVDANACVYGESGTKIAGIIHALSNRRNGPLITFDCATAPEGLAESQLFGHVRGAFPGGVENREG